MKKFLTFAVLNFVLFLGAAIFSSSARAQSAYVTIQCNDTNNPQINSQSTDSLSLQSGNATCTAIAYSGIASGYWQYSYNGGPFRYLTGARVSVSRSGIPYGTYQVQAIGTDANGDPITTSNVVTINYSADGGGGGGSGGGGGGTVQVPGPSQALFASPYYQCVTNYYVAPNGNDSASGSSGSPWLTLQHADSMNVGPGACINVAPGTYDGVLITHGGNAATATGYVVYLCQTLDGCTINGNGGQNASSVSFDYSNVSTTKSNTVNYVQFDGFNMVGFSGSNYAYGIGWEVSNGNNGAANGSHHIWLLNSIVHGFVQSGVQIVGADYQYVIHNTLYGNAYQQCDAQGSGISIYQANPLPSYTPTADDQTNPNPLLGPTWVVGSSFFHVVFEYNVTYNNHVTCGGGSATDGNGIIFDSNSRPYGGNTTDYTEPMLAAFNVSYNNGGVGVHVFGSVNVTVANNTCYNNNLDTNNPGTFRGCIDDNDGATNTFINNIAVDIPAVASCNGGKSTAWNDAYLGSPSGAADTFSNNLADTIGVSCAGLTFMQNGDVFNSPPNLSSVSPEWVNVGTSSVGTETTQPVGTNFALSPGSPAIGAGLTEPYLPASSVDLGACASALTTCP